MLRDPSIVLNRQHKWVINLIFPLIRISPHWFSCSEVYFTTIIFYYVGETPPDVQWRKRKTKLSRTWRGKFFSSIWVLGQFFYFVFEKTSDSLPMWLVTTVVPAGKHSNRRSQMFYKTDALKSLAIFTGKHLCWRFFLINFIKKRLQHRCFPVKIAKCLSTAFYIEHFVPIHYTFQNFYVMIEFFGFFRC